MDEYEMPCEYCHNPVSVFESITEYRKHYHQACYIQRAQKELEGYKKKWLDGKMSKGDKTIFLDKYELVKKLMTAPESKFRGWTPVAEKKRERITTEKRMVLEKKTTGYKEHKDEKGNVIKDVDGRSTYIPLTNEELADPFLKKHFVEDYVPVLGEDGKPLFEEVKTAQEMTTLSMRPDVLTIEPKKSKKELGEAKAKKKLTAADIPRLMLDI